MQGTDVILFPHAWLYFADYVLPYIAAFFVTGLLPFTFYKAIKDSNAYFDSLQEEKEEEALKADLMEYRRTRTKKKRKHPTTGWNGDWVYTNKKYKKA